MGKAQSYSICSQGLTEVISLLCFHLPLVSHVFDLMQHSLKTEVLLGI